MVDDAFLNLQITQTQLDKLNVSYDSSMNGNLAIELVKNRLQIIEKSDALLQERVDFYKLLMIDYQMKELDGP